MVATRLSMSQIGQTEAFPGISPFLCLDHVHQLIRVKCELFSVMFTANEAQLTFMCV